jgi:hypothetical protein
MNKQEIVDKVVPLILKNGLSFQKGTCRYRKNESATDRIRCAVGYLISDEHYKPELEGKRANSVGIIEALNKSGYNFDGEFRFLSDLQEAHDKAAMRSSSTMEHFLTYIKKLCFDYRLNFNPEWGG